MSDFISLKDMEDLFSLQRKNIEAVVHTQAKIENAGKKIIDKVEQHGEQLRSIEQQLAALQPSSIPVAKKTRRCQKRMHSLLFNYHKCASAFHSKAKGKQVAAANAGYLTLEEASIKNQFELPLGSFYQIHGFSCGKDENKWFNALLEENTETKLVDPCDKMLVKLREQRNNSVQDLPWTTADYNLVFQTDHQYLFVHQVMLNYFMEWKFLDPSAKPHLERFTKEYDKIVIQN